MLPHDPRVMKKLLCFQYMSLSWPVDRVRGWGINDGARSLLKMKVEYVNVLQCSHYCKRRLYLHWGINLLNRFYLVHF